METLKNLGYRIERFFRGETGIVERVDESPSKNHLGEVVNYLKDEYGNYPYNVTFRNSLGELISTITYPKIKQYYYANIAL